MTEKMEQYDCRMSLIQSFPKGSVGAEIGVYEGQFSKNILHTVQPRIFYMVDCWDNTKEYANCIEPPIESLARVMTKVRRHIATGVARVIRALSVEGARYVPDESLDWVFIDASHFEENVWDDMHAWIPKVKPGGIVSGHDYPPPAEKKCRPKFLKIGMGVGKAVQRYVQEHGIEDLGFTDDLPASWYFRKP